MDFLTPLAVLSIAVLLYSRIHRIGSDAASSSSFWDRLSKIVLFLGFILYVDGHGIHLSANALARLFDKIQNPDFFQAAYSFDEIISHYMWDSGVFLISISMIFACFRLPRKKTSSQNLFLIFLGAAFYGFTFAVNGIEGQTVGFVSAAALVGFVLTAVNFSGASPRLKENPVRIFFLVGYTISLILIAYWGIRHGGFPQFTELGWI
jgi:hypothetical protein